MNVEFPTLKGNVEDVVKGLVGWMDKAIQRRQWTNAEIDEKFANRTVEQILDDGNTCYMNPCFDFVQVALLALRDNGYRTTLFAEELEQKGYNHTRIHFALEFEIPVKDEEDENKIVRWDKYFIDFKSMNKVVYGDGAYTTSRDDVKQIHRMRFPGERFNTNSPFFIGLGADSREDVDTLFLDYKFAPQFERLKHDNVPGTFLKYLKCLEGNESLFAVSEEEDF